MMFNGITVFVVQSDAFNRSRILTVVVRAITSNMRLATAPGIVSFTRRQTGLTRASVLNVSHVLTQDRRFRAASAGMVSDGIPGQVEEGLQLVLGLRP